MQSNAVCVSTRKYTYTYLGKGVSRACVLPSVLVTVRSCHDHTLQGIRRVQLRLQGWHPQKWQGRSPSHTAAETSVAEERKVSIIFLTPLAVPAYTYVHACRHVVVIDCDKGWC